MKDPFGAEKEQRQSESQKHNKSIEKVRNDYAIHNTGTVKAA